MKRPNITPGNWHVGVKGPENMVYGENGEQVTAYNIMLPDDELKVNAKAIAALPDLLAALEACLLRLYNDDEQLEPEYLQASEALIKAGYTF